MLLVMLFVFVFMLGCDSDAGKVLKRLNYCQNIGEVKRLYEGNKNAFETFSDSVRAKIGKLNFPEEVTNACTSWLPPAPMSLNLIVVPDLSKRIIDTTNNPGQAGNDMELLNYIFEAFKKTVSLKNGTKDRLIVDVTDPWQANGQFGKLADSMIVDLSENKEGVHKRYFNKGVAEKRYKINVEALYALGTAKPTGADFVVYFENKLKDHIKTSTLFERYRNALIIITDGYLEADHKLYTGSYPVRMELARKLRPDSLSKELILKTLKIDRVSRKFPTLDVLVLEVNERTKRSPDEPNDPGTPLDYKILNVLWTDWFQDMKIKNAEDDVFVRRHDAIRVTKEKIDVFLNK
jgi:hypothetical protein